MHKIIACLFIQLFLTGCLSQTTSKIVHDGHPTRIPDISKTTNAQVPRAVSKSKYGNPKSYVVFNKRYHVMPSAKGYQETGLASWYGTKFHGRNTSSGEPYDMFAMTAAHKTLPLPTYAEVKNLNNGRKIIVKINDRGPFHGNRIIDLSYTAAAKLGIIDKGTGHVAVRAIDPKQYHAKADRATRLAEERIRPRLKLGGQHASLRQDTTIASSQRNQSLLQLGAFSQHENAKELKEQLAALDLAPIQIQRHGSQKALYKVHLGPVDNDALDEVVAHLAANNIHDPLAVPISEM